MIRILPILIVNLVCLNCFSQYSTIKEIDELEQKVRMQKKMIIMFEILDSIDVSGKHVEFARTYYVDKKSKDVLLITTNENRNAPNRGLQLFYVYSENKLVKAGIRPSKKSCRICTAAYYFSNDSLIHRNEVNFSVPDVFTLLRQSRTLAVKASGKLHR